MKIGSQTCPFETFTEGNDKAKFCNEFSKYIEGVCKHFFNSNNFLHDNLKLQFNLSLYLKTTYI